MMEIEHAILKFGKVTEVDYANGLARVAFQDDEDLVSNWLAVSVPKSRNDKYISFVDKDDFVWCMLDEHCEYGVIGGALYSEKNKPNGTDKKSGVKYSDGSELFYDKEAKEWKLKINNTILSVKDGQTTFNDGSNGGLAITSVLTEKYNALEQDLNNLKAAFSAWVPLAQDGGAALKTATGSWASSTITPTLVADITNDKVKH